MLKHDVKGIDVDEVIHKMSMIIKNMNMQIIILFLVKEMFQSPFETVAYPNMGFVTLLLFVVVMPLPWN